MVGRADGGVAAVGGGKKIKSLRNFPQEAKKALYTRGLSEGRRAIPECSGIPESSAAGRQPRQNSV
jgi:hypothetical protein